ncbi:hypothetical protein EON65_27485 [archaeon]|nr:MAG: hypothetical protein EON65_27485 [archaeon]
MQEALDLLFGLFSRRAASAPWYSFRRFPEPSCSRLLDFLSPIFRRPIHLSSPKTFSIGCFCPAFRSDDRYRVQCRGCACQSRAHPAVCPHLKNVYSKKLDP